MGLITIITSIILASGAGVGGYFIIKNKSKPIPKPPKSNPAVSLTINVGKIQNKP